MNTSAYVRCRRILSMSALIREAEGERRSGDPVIGKSGDRKAKSLQQITQMSADQRIGTSGKSEHRKGQKTASSSRVSARLRGEDWAFAKSSYLHPNMEKQ